MNFLSIFVLIPLLMLAGLWAARGIKAIRGVMVTGASALLIASVVLTFLYLGERSAGNTAEMLLEAKGFTDVVVSITEDSCDVVLNMGEVTDAKRAQVEDIVKRKTNVSAENVIITPIVVGEVDTE